MAAGRLRLRGRQLYKLAALVIAMLLVWALVFRDYLSWAFTETDPGFALQFKTGDVEALVGVGDDKLAQAQTRPAFSAALPTALEAMARSPLDVRTVRNVAVAMSGMGDTHHGDALMRVALGRSRRDFIVDAWLFDLYQTAGRPAEAMQLANEMLLSDPGNEDVLLPVLAEATQRPAAALELARQLAAQPAWRDDFFSSLDSGTAPLPGLHMLVADLARSSKPVSGTELTPLLDRYIAGGDYVGARALWQQSARRTPTIVYDGGFEQMPGAAPFNWTLASGYGLNITQTADVDPLHRTALRVQTYGGKPFHSLAREQVVVPAGNYQFSFDSRSEQRGQGAGLRWVVTCPDGTSVIEAAPNSDVTWAHATLPFTVSATCPSVQVRLQGSTDGGDNSGAVWIDSVSIDRVK